MNSPMSSTRTSPDPGRACGRPFADAPEATINAITCITRAATATTGRGLHAGQAHPTEFQIAQASD